MARGGQARRLRPAVRSRVIDLRREITVATPRRWPSSADSHTASSLGRKGRDDHQVERRVTGGVPLTFQGFARLELLPSSGSRGRHRKGAKAARFSKMSGSSSQVGSHVRRRFLRPRVCRPLKKCGDRKAARARPARPRVVRCPQWASATSSTRLPGRWARSSRSACSPSAASKYRLLAPVLPSLRT